MLFLSGSTAFPAHSSAHQWAGVSSESHRDTGGIWKNQHFFHWLPFTKAMDCLISPVFFRAEEKGTEEKGEKVGGEGGDTAEKPIHPVQRGKVK